MEIICKNTFLLSCFPNLNLLGFWVEEVIKRGGAEARRKMVFNEECRKAGMKRKNRTEHPADESLIAANSLLSASIRVHRWFSFPVLNNSFRKTIRLTLFSCGWIIFPLLFGHDQTELLDRHCRKRWESPKSRASRHGKKHPDLQHKCPDTARF